MGGFFASLATFELLALYLHSNFGNPPSEPNIGGNSYKPKLNFPKLTPLNYQHSQGLYGAELFSFYSRKTRNMETLPNRSFLKFSTWGRGKYRTIYQERNNKKFF